MSSKNAMTVEEREAIFSKEIITIDELAKLYDSSYSTAQSMMTKIKEALLTKQGFIRCDINGKLHIQDYLDYYKIPPDRYVKVKKITLEQEKMLSVLREMENAVLNG